MTTDAASLHAMVRGYMGEGWWPEGLEYGESDWGPYWYSTAERVGDADLLPREAAALIRDAVTEALMARTFTVLWRPRSGTYLVSTPEHDSYAPTRLEALLRVWDAVRGREGA